MLLLQDKFRTDPGLRSGVAIADSAHWNLWSNRLKPYHQLRDGTEIAIVDRWPGGRRVSWLIAATHVLAEPYASKAKAITRIADATGRTRADVRDHEYTTRGPDQGYLIAFRYKPIRRIGVDDPVELRFWRHGWMEETSSSVLRRWGLDLEPTRAARFPVDQTGKVKTRNPGRSRARPTGEDNLAAPSFGGTYHSPPRPRPSSQAVFVGDPNVRDRGTNAHWLIQSSIAALVDRRGLKLAGRRKGDPDIDVGWQERDGTFMLVEVKSTTEENQVHQLRLGVGQVLDYGRQVPRNAKRIKLFLAVEHPVPDHWVSLAAGHGVTIVWPTRIDGVRDPDDVVWPTDAFRP